MLQGSVTDRIFPEDDIFTLKATLNILNPDLMTVINEHDIVTSSHMI